MLTRLRGAGPGRQAVGHQQRWSVAPGALSPSDPHTVQDGEALPESKGQCCLVHVRQMWIRQEKGRK